MNISQNNLEKIYPEESEKIIDTLLFGNPHLFFGRKMIIESHREGRKLKIKKWSKLGRKEIV